MTTPARQTVIGIGSALAVIGGWIGVVAYSLTRYRVEVDGWPLGVVLLLITTHLYTGLFITAHDAMHESLAPGRPWINRVLGRVAVALYAAFPYSVLAREHRTHHRAPASGEDPDFHAEGAPGFLAWYLRFVLHYVRPLQILTLAVVGESLMRLGGLPRPNVYLLWVLPALLSTLQLFYFGTYLPHRRQPAPDSDRHRSRSNDYPAWLSFVSCYHFGYHWEHHQYPETPWWRLPKRRAETLSRSLHASESAR